jgi:hypothetical protein
VSKLAATMVAAILLSSFPAVMVGHAHAETRATRVKSVTVDYEHGPVAQDHPGQRVRISFSATAGDQVRLLTDRAYGALRRCEQVTLSDDTGLLSRDRSSFWPVPRDGVHVFEFVPCDEATEPVTLQLIRLRITPLDPSGSTPMPVGRYVEALEVTVPATGTLAIRPTENGAFFSQVLPPTGPLRRASGGVALFEPGRSLLRLGSPADPAMPRNLTRPMQAGERFLLLTNWDAMLISSLVPEHHVTSSGSPS